MSFVPEGCKRHDYTVFFILFFFFITRLNFLSRSTCRCRFRLCATEEENISRAIVNCSNRRGKLCSKNVRRNFVFKSWNRTDGGRKGEGVGVGLKKMAGDLLL